MRMGWLWNVVLCLGVSGICQAAPTCRLEVNQKLVLLNRYVDPEVDFSHALNLLQEFDASRAQIQTFREKLKDGAIRTGRLEASAVDVARFDVVQGVPTILLRKGELGVLAVLIFHEVVHALDEDYSHRFFRLPLAEVSHSKTQLRFLAERLAYDSQQMLLEEMMRSDFCVKSYFEYHASRKRIITHPLSDEALSSLLEHD